MHNTKAVSSAKTLNLRKDQGVANVKKGQSVPASRVAQPYVLRYGTAEMGLVATARRCANQAGTENFNERV
jgi:hypothetical protein